MNKADKPVVQYRPSGWDFINVDQRANVYAIDHPRLGADWVSTSQVLSYDSNTGEFETLNTVYVRQTQQ